MTPVPLTPEHVEALCAASGLSLSPERRARLLAARHIVDALRGRLWVDLPYEAEPGHVFLAGGTSIRAREGA